MTKKGSVPLSPSINKGLVMGTEIFKGEIELRLKRRIRPEEMGRPQKRGEENLL